MIRLVQRKVSLSSEDGWRGTIGSRLSKPTPAAPGSRGASPVSGRSIQMRFQDRRREALFDALVKAEAQARESGSVEAFVNAFTPMIPHIEAFFDEVLVMADDPKLQQNRLGLLDRIVGLAQGVADLSQLEGF